MWWPWSKGNGKDETPEEAPTECECEEEESCEPRSLDECADELEEEVSIETQEFIADLPEPLKKDKKTLKRLRASHRKTQAVNKDIDSTVLRLRDIREALAKRKSKKS